MRELLDCERPLVVYLFELASIPVHLDALQVQPMADGGMGSLTIAPIDNARKIGRVPVECHFYDSDNILVSAALNLDENGDPFEIDVWKVDFSPLVQWPSRQGLIAGPPPNGTGAPKPRRGVQ